MALTEIERELQNLRRMLAESMEWNWLDAEDMPEDEFRTCLPDMHDLRLEIIEALDGTQFSIRGQS